jgi:site-specific DNA recombinase
MAVRKRRVVPTVEIDPTDPDGLLGLEALGPVEHVFDDRGKLLYSVVVPTAQPPAQSEDVPQTPVGLARISDARGGDTEKVDRQCRRILAGNQKRGWGPIVVVVENDTSAFKRRKVTLPNGEVSWRTWRPGFRRIVGWLTDATHDGFLAIHLDRVVRDHRDYADLRDAVIMRNPRPKVDSLTGSLKMENNADIQAGWFWVTIAASASEDTARRVADRRLVQAENGVYGGGCRPFGFGLVVGVDMAGDPVRDVTKQIPEEAAEIRWAAEQLLAGASLRELAADLRGRKVLTSTGKQWTAGTLRDVMLRPRNAGLSKYCGEIVEGVMIEGVDEDHPPILERSTWEAVVALLTNPQRQTTTGPAPRWLGSGLYLCGHPDCVNGNPRNVMTVQKSAGKSHKRWKVNNYVCKGPVAHLTRIAETLDEHIEAVVVAHLMQPHAVNLCTPQKHVDTAALATEANAIREVIEDLGDLHQRRKITKAERERRTDQLEAELEVVMSQLRGSAGVDPLKSLAGNPKAKEVWEAMSMPAKRAVIRRVLRVTVLPSRPGPPVGYKRGSGKPYFKPESIRIEWLTPDTR